MIEGYRCAIVTGGGTGIGRGVVQALVNAGAKCVITGRRQEPLAAVARELGPDSVSTVTADITEPEDRSRVVAHAVETFGRLDILVNNAGITAVAPILDYSLEDWRRVMATHVEGSFFLSQLALEHMARQRYGRIVNIGSVYGSLGLNNDYYGDRLPWGLDGRGPVREVAYSAAKGAVLQLTRELATAVGRWNITVNTVTPGIIPVASNPMADEVLDRLAKMTPLGRVGTTADIGAAVAFLASDAAGYITGAELRVDGGWSIW